MTRHGLLRRFGATALTLCLATSTAVASDACTADRPEGSFVVIAQRNASDVVSTLSAIEAYAPVVETVDFDATSFTWINGESCLEDWSLTELEHGPVWLDDPLLGDALLAPIEGATDRRILRNFRIDCGARELGSFTMVDAGLLLTAAPNGAVNVILEKPLNTGDAQALSDALTVAGHDVAADGGSVGPATRQAIAREAEARGTTYRFEPTVISRNLLEALGVDCPD